MDEPRIYQRLKKLFSRKSSSEGDSSNAKKRLRSLFLTGVVGLSVVILVILSVSLFSEKLKPATNDVLDATRIPTKNPITREKLTVSATPAEIPETTGVELPENTTESTRTDLSSAITVASTGTSSKSITADQTSKTVLEPIETTSTKAKEMSDGQPNEQGKTLEKQTVPQETFDKSKFVETCDPSPVTSDAETKESSGTKEIPILLENQEKGAESLKTSTETGYAFVRITPVSVLADLETRKEIARLKIGDFVRPLEKAEVNGVEYTKILRKTPNGDLVGWVRSSYLSSSLSEVIGKKFDEITFPVFPKRVGRVKDVRGIFLTRYSVNTRSKIREWIAFAKRNNLNAFVIDVKDDDGFLLFKMDIGAKMVPRAYENAFYTKEEMKEILEELKSNGIYVIARIVCFKDPSYAKTYPERAIVYKDTGQPYMGIYKVPWASAYDRQLWKYNVEVARETIEVGFDEIQYDYIRFPELREDVKARLDLRQQDPDESFPEAIQRFLLYVRKELGHYSTPLAIDVFGLTSSAIDDVGIGQHWEALSSIVDYMCPMVYPSHYANGVFGLPVPDAYPYETVYNSVLDGIKRNLQLPSPARIRPWIQSFTATWVKGHIVYDERAIRKQIKALKDLGINEYMLWNAANKYIEMQYD